MSVGVGQPLTAAAMTQVKVCPYHEEEPTDYLVPPCRGSVRRSGYKIAKAQVCQCACHSAKTSPSGHSGHSQCLQWVSQPFDDLKVVLLGQFGTSKWQSYFELLRLPLDMQGLKPSILLGKLKQSLPHGVSPDNDLFLAMFLIWLPLSMQEAVGSRNYKTAQALVRAEDALWDAHGSHDPTIMATTTHRNKTPAPAWGKRGDKRARAASSKSCSPSNQDFFSFKTLARACASITITTIQGPTSV
jgi:hypothetical protein